MSCWMSSSRLQTTFTGPSTCCAILTASSGAVDLEPPAEAAAEQVVVDPDRVLRQPGDLGDHGLGQGRRLGADPDVAAVLADMDGAVHRLHRRMGEERQLIDRVDPLRRAGERLLGVALVARHRAGLLRRLLELADDVGAVDRRVRAVVPLDGGRLEPLLGRPHMVGDHGDGIVDPHHLAHALDRARRRLVHRFRLAAEHRRDGDRRDLHARQLGVDAELGAAVDLVRRVQPLGRRADQGEVLRILQRHAVGRRHRQGGGGVHQLAVAQAARAGRVRDHAVPRPAGGGIDAPLLGRRRDQQGAGDRAGLAQRRPEGADRGRKAGRLDVQDRIGIERVVRRRMLEPDLIEADLQLLRQQHGQRRCRCPGPSRPSASPASPRPGGRCG